jgi:anti-sigma regulatory factor (Ser/Thr protein kinase)
LGVVSPEQFDTTLEYYRYASGSARLLLCSDGATEMSVSAGKNLGHAGLLEGSRHASAEPLFERMAEVIEAHLPESGPDDDIALILVECPIDRDVVAAPEFIQQSNILLDKNKSLCDYGKNGEHLWELAVTLTAPQLRRMDVVPFLINITGQINGGNPGGKVFLVLSELFNNALDHGVLKLDSSLKNGGEGMERYFEERKLRLAELQSGQISIVVQRQGCANCSCLKITFKDSGSGFDYHASRSEALNRNTQHHGRGISLLASICNEFRYSGNGSEVMACLDGIE